MTTTTAERNGRVDEQPKDNRAKRGSHPRWVPVNQTKVSPQAQRELRPAFVEHLAQNFDPDKLGLPVVNLRDDIFWVIDGQHRIEAMKLMGWDDQQILCEAFDGMSERWEAEQFLARQDRITVKTFDKFKIALTAEREVEQDVDRIVRALGLKIGGGGPGSINAVAALTKVYHRSGPGGLSRTLKIIKESYGGAGFGAPVLLGVGLLIQRFGSELDDGVAVAKLSQAIGGVNGLLNRAQVLRKQLGRPVNQCVAAAAVEFINAGRGGKKLPDWWK